MTENDHSMLIVLAHPDDESFSIGGTLAKYADQGVRVTLVCATKGELGIPELSARKTSWVRERELRAAADVLGLSEVIFLGLRDGELSQADSAVVINQLVTILQELQPQVVITFGPDGISGHPDHIAIHQLTTAAFNRAGINGYLYYIAHSEATLQGCGVPPPEESSGGPTVGIDFGDYLVTKVEAMQCHASQKPPYPGRPEDEAQQLSCHEYFVLAYPVLEDISTEDLFMLTENRELYHD
jgi:LmbE family N-acetylglucosaminyl deacetylase